MQPERSAQTTLAFHSSRIVIDVGVILAMASMSMTFISAPGGDRSALAADALPALLLLLPIFAVTLIPDHTRPLHPVFGWISMVLGLAALPYAFVKMLDAGVLADTLGGSVGLGPKILLLGCVVTLLGIGIGLVRDLMGWPSGGTPNRSVTARRPRDGHTAPQKSRPSADRARAETAVTPDEATRMTTPKQPTPAVGAAADTAATRVIPKTGEAPPAPSESKPAPVPQKSETRPTPTAQPSRPVEPERASTQPAPRPAARPSDEAATAPTAPVPPARPTADDDQPGMLFPDLASIAPEPEPEPNDDLMSTAERADAALTDHLLSMFDDSDFEDDFDDDPDR